MPGLTPTGFEIKTLEQIQESLVTDQRSEIDPGLDVEAETVLGQLNGIFGSALAECWEQLQEVYKTFDRDAAEDDALDSLGTLLGVPRPEDSPSTAPLTLNLDAGTTVPAGSIVALETRNDVQFVSLEPVTNSGFAPANFTVDFECTVDGPTAAPAGQLNEIITPVTGWNTATNALDAKLGRLTANNQEYRALLERAVAIQGSATVRAIQADVLQANEDLVGDPIISVTVYENTGDTVDSNGLPGHSIEVLIFDDQDPGNDEVIALRIWRAKAAGIGTYGNVSTIVETDAGDNVEMFFSRPTLKPVWVELTVSVNPAIAPADVADLVKAQIVSFGEQITPPGTDVIALAVRASALQVTSVVDVPEFTIGFAVSPTEDENLVLGIREVADYDTSRIAVTIQEVSP
jgi:uncharacterized phage protein gp47/JayE